MSVPAFDIDNFVPQEMPVNYRNNSWIALLRSFLSGLSWNSIKFDDYRNGAIYGYWSGVVTYADGDRVIDLFGVYVSLSDGNTGNPTTDATYWYRVGDYFIGASERVMYTPRKLTFEWALNRYFNTTFRQPDDPVAPTNSDIFISTSIPTSTSVIMYPDAARSSRIYPTMSAPRYMFDTIVTTAATSYRFAINIPVAVYTALGTSPAIRESIVRRFADKYTRMGAFYDIVTY